MVRPRFSLRTLLLGTAFIAAVCATLRFPNLWLASAWCLTTVAVLLFSIVATAQSRHRSRAFWLGFAVCGWGYFYLTLFPSPHFPGVAARLATTRVLVSLYWALNPNLGWSTGGELRPNTTLTPTLEIEDGVGGGFSGDGLFYPPSGQGAQDDESLDIAPLEPSNRSNPVESDPFGDTGTPDNAEYTEYSGTLTLGGGQTPVIIAGTRSNLLSLEDYVRLGNLLWTLLFAFCGGIAGRWLHDTREHSAAR